MELFWYDIRTMSQAEYDSAVAGMTTERRQQLSDAATDDDRRRMAGCELLVRQHLQLAQHLERQPVCMELRQYLMGWH